MTFTKLVRTDIGITVKELSTVSGLSCSEISLIENGRLRPSDGQLAKLVAGFTRAGANGITPQQLVREVNYTDLFGAQVPA